MKHIIYLLIGLLVICGSATSSFGQKNKDSFSGKSKKGPNVYSSKPPRGASKGKLYGHSISKKKIRKNRNSIFSSSKRRYKSVNAKPGKGDKGASGASGGRKSGKGRKKNK